MKQLVTYGLLCFFLFVYLGFFFFYMKSDPLDKTCFREQQLQQMIAFEAGLVDFCQAGAAIADDFIGVNLLHVFLAFFRRHLAGFCGQSGCQLRRVG